MDIDAPSIREQLEACADLLEAIEKNRALLADAPKELRDRLLRAAGLISLPSHRDLRKLRKEEARRRKQNRREQDERALDASGIRKARTAAIFATPSGDAPRELQPPPAADESQELHTPRGCYICKKNFTKVHAFYDSMCQECGDFNWSKRQQSADLSGRVALVTGARVKIGYQAAIKLLRAGAHVVVVSRFPGDAAQRYCAEDDFEQWAARLQIHGLDLRHTPSVEAFCTQLLKRLPRLDFILNNACQTVRRPAGFYAHLMDAERSLTKLPEAATALIQSGAPQQSGPSALVQGQLGGGSAELSQLPLLADDIGRDLSIFPEGQLDADLQQRDLRKVNSWRLLLHEVPSVELLEVHLVNAVAPFILNARLKPLMTRFPSSDKHIVNVSAMEGQFYRTFKTARHPHTNMAKAGLNMLTRTSAPDYVRDGIHMNSVDTGWVTDEDPAHHAERKVREHHFHPPLDIVDGAARICAPIFDGFTSGEHVWGRFLKDYRSVDW